MAEVEWRVLNPTAEYEKRHLARAPRIDALAGKRIGLFWNGKTGGETLLDAVGESLRTRFKDVQLIKFYEFGHGISAASISKITESCDAVVSAVGD